MSFRTWLTLLPVMVIACGDSQMPPELSSCSDAWQVAFTVENELPPHQVVLSDGRLHYSNYPASPLDSNELSPDADIRSVSTQGGDPVILVKDWATSLWIEPDRILYAHGQELFSAPRAGGDPVRLAGMLPTDSDRAPLSFHQAVIGTAFYFAQVGRRLNDAGTLWRSDFGTNTSQMVATLAFAYHGDPKRLIPWHGDILAVGSGDETLLVPAAGGEPRRLGADLGHFVAAADDTMLWAKFLDTAGKPAITMRRSDRDGANARAFWSDKPATLHPAITGHGASGEWLIAGTETFTDGRDHLSVWRLDEAGVGERIACNPAPWSEASFPTQLIAAPDASYVVHNVETHRAYRWNLVRIPR